MIMKVNTIRKDEKTGYIKPQGSLALTALMLSLRVTCVIMIVLLTYLTLDKIH